MSLVANQVQRKTIPLIYRMHYLFFAACIVLGILAMLFQVVTSPQYYSLQSGASSVFATFMAANPALLQAHLVAGVLAVYFLPLSLLAMAWLAMRRAPWLASIAILITLIGIIPIGAYSAQDALTYDLAHIGRNPLFLAISVLFNGDAVMSYYNVIFILGTVLAPTLIGIALWRSRAIPIWAAVLITVSRPLVLVLYSLLLGFPGIYLQFLTWVPMLIGSVAAAWAMAKIPYNER